MINGKFYTGLPPRMINRSNTQVPNRMESNFYWPDDTDTETATETRVRRRASLSLAPVNKPVVQQRNNDEVNTKQMLHNQFSKSSIQFFDNINEEEEEENRPFKRAAKKEITCKPTATKLQQLPNSDAEAAAIKNKHMFKSKLEFNDYLGEDINMRNNMRKNKIDMNDKYDVERNTKNSPKLQNKRNVQNLIENIPYNSEDEERELQRKSRAKSMEFRNRNNKYRRDQTPKRMLNMRHGVDYSDYPECRDSYLDNETTDRVDEAFKHMQINGRRPILKKRVSYSEEEEEIPVRHYYNRHNAVNDEEHHKRKHVNKYKFGHSHAHALNNNDLDQDQHFVENNKMNNNNEVTTNALAMSVNSNNNHHPVFNMAQKHLRSSLCFYDGEIVSDNEATSPTSSSTAQRRNARSSTQRVSVGLPD